MAACRCNSLNVFLPAVALVQVILIFQLHIFGGLRHLVVEQIHDHQQQPKPASVETNVTVTHHSELQPPIIEEYTFDYPDFERIPEPHFLDGSSHREEYHRHYRHDRQWNMTSEIRTGKITVIQNGMYDPSDSCGYKSDYTRHYPKRIAAHHIFPGKVVALKLKSAKHFQHFVDSAMPKLIQAKVYLDENPDAVIMSHFANAKQDSIIRQLLESLGIHHSLIPWRTPLSAKELVLLCKAPPMHPILWKRARDLLGVKRYPVGDKIVWVTRNEKNSKHGRLVLNERQVQQYLITRFGNDFVEYDSNKNSLNKTIQLFQQARVILGLHGGGLYNTMFAPDDATLVEIMPTSQQGKPLGAMDQIFWKISGMLHQPYWRLNQVQQPRTEGSVKVNVTQIGNVLDSILLTGQQSQSSIF